MARTLDKIRSDAMQLGVEERGALADSIAESFMTSEELEIQEAWMQEAARRIADYDAGKVKGIPHEDVMRHLREKYSGKSGVSRRRGSRAR